MPTIIEASLFCTTRQPFPKGAKMNSPTILAARSLSVFAVSTIVLISLVALASASPGPKALTPAQAVLILNRVIQARFKQNMGEFGADRVQHEVAAGHPDVDGLLYGATPSETAALKPVTSAPYFMILGIMHVRHKPGMHGQAADLNDTRDFTPSAGVIEASGTTDERAERTFYWGNDNLPNAVKPYYARVTRGESIDTSYQKFYVFIRPVKAWHDSCTRCHVGTHIGDTLGAMVYMVARTPNGKPATSTWDGGGE